MCLNTISKKPLEKKSGIGWKVFRLRAEDATLHRVCQGTEDPYPELLWLKEINYRKFMFGSYSDTISISGGKEYPKGFHVIKTERGARVFMISQGLDEGFHVVRKVRYRRAVSHGAQNHVGCIVVKEMKILP